MFLLSGLDIILILILFFFFTIGFVYGFVQSIGTLVGLVVGIWAANEYYLAISDWIVKAIPGLDKLFLWFNYDWFTVIVFILFAVLVLKLVGLVFTGIDRIVRLLYIIPFFKTFNRILGALVGLLEAGLIIGLIVHFLSHFELLKPFVAGYIEDSKVAGILSKIGEFLTPLLPALIEKIRSLF